jgi:2,3,4,5-tetrahydropyridine-2-carboxylate N-succinyltransferase
VSEGLATELREKTEALYALPPESLGDDAHAVFQRLLHALEKGDLRAAEPGADGWSVNGWVKKGILLGFRLGRMVATDEAGPLRFFDKDTFLPRKLTLADGVRVVPGGTAVRSGAYLAPGVVIMPPAYVNVGAWVGEGTMVDSHALVGSCAQVGRRVHLSAGAMLGGVLEPVGALPVIVEDDVLVGGNCGVYEGTVVRERAVLAPGVLLTGGTAVVDLVRDMVYRREEDRPLEIPAGAVVVPGTRPVRSGVGRERGISLYAPVIVKYRDDRTDASVQLEALLR